jgi:hypothetical protein
MLNWDKFRKLYPETIQEIQDWFCETTGFKTKTWFYKQPVWRNEVFPIFLSKAKGIKIGFDVKWNETNKTFAFIYAIVDGDQMVPPTDHYTERSIAELMSYAHVLQYINDKRKQDPNYVAPSPIITEEQLANEQINKANATIKKLDIANQIGKSL